MWSQCIGTIQLSLQWSYGILCTQAAQCTVSVASVHFITKFNFDDAIKEPRSSQYSVLLKADMIIYIFDWMKVYWIKLASELEAGTVLWSIKLWLPKSFLEKLVLQVQLICRNHYGLGLHLVSSNFILKDVAWVNYCIIWGTCI